ncbi:MAG TPA: SRPBCC domain-containing protein [Rickettsiales bacterium]|nr:SRPBCC domain-containing protein [Rickettsiales bacterium]
MNTENFTTSILVSQTPQEAFNAINNVRAWWSGEIQGKTGTVGDEFTYRYKDMHRSTQKVTELVSGKKVVWDVVDASLSFTDNETEWKGTTIIFDIAVKGKETEIRFTHQGLTPHCECYGACSEGWSMLINDNLRQLIASGKNQPDVFAESA